MSVCVTYAWQRVGDGAFVKPVRLCGARAGRGGRGRGGEYGSICFHECVFVVVVGMCCCVGIGGLWRGSAWCRRVVVASMRSLVRARRAKRGLTLHSGGTSQELPRAPCTRVLLASTPVTHGYLDNLVSCPCLQLKLRLGRARSVPPAARTPPLPPADV